MEHSRTTAHETGQASAPRKMLGRDAAAERLNIRRTKLNELIRSGQLPAVKLGTRTLIPEDCLERFMASLPPVCAAGATSR